MLSVLAVAVAVVVPGHPAMWGGASLLGVILTTLI
jgi:hypothetical protein